MLFAPLESLGDHAAPGVVRRSTFLTRLDPVVVRAQRAEVAHAVVVAGFDVIHVGCGRGAASTRLCERGALPCIPPQDSEPDLGPVLR